MHAVLNFSCANNPNPALGPAAPIPTENQSVLTTHRYATMLTVLAITLS